MDVGGQRYALPALHTGNGPLPIVQEAGWAPALVYKSLERAWKILLQPGYDSRTVQPVVSCYTDHVFPAHIKAFYISKSSLIQSNFIPCPKQ